MTLGSWPRGPPFAPELCFLTCAGSSLHLPITQVRLKPAGATTGSGNWTVSGGVRAGRGLKESKLEPQIPSGRGNSPRAEQAQDFYWPAAASPHGPTPGVVTQSRPLLSRNHHAQGLWLSLPRLPPPCLTCPCT